MNRSRTPDSSHLLTSAAVSTAAAVGAINATAEVSGAITSAYRDYLAVGGKHIPELLLVPFLLLLSMALAGAEFAASIQLTSVASLPTFVLKISGLIGLMVVSAIWIAVIGGLLGRVAKAGQGAVLNAVWPLVIAISWGATHHHGTLAALTIPAWIGCRLVAAALTSLPIYLKVRGWMSISVVVITTLLPVVIVFSRLYIDPASFGSIVIPTR